MDTALTTGMFTTSFLSNQLVRKDVTTNNKDEFEKFFNESLNNKKVENENVQKESSTKDTDINKIEDENNNDNVSENKRAEEDKDTIKIKDKLKKKKDVSKQENVKELSEDVLKKLDELLEKLDVEPDEMLDNIDVCESVDEVGLQLVETEKITLNLEDVEGNEEVSLSEDVDNLGENSENFINYMDENTNESMLNKKEDSKDDKLKIKDFRSRTDNFNVSDFSNRGKFEIDNVSFKQGNVLNNITDMQEKMDVLKQVTEKMDVSLFDDKSEMVMKLKPDDLGKVTVKLSLENGIISAKFLAESEKVKEILESNFNQLKDSLEKQGMMIQEFSVSVDNGESKENMFYEKRHKLFNKKDDELDTSFDYNNVSYYDYEEADVNNYWPDSTISFSA